MLDVSPSEFSPFYNELVLGRNAKTRSKNAAYRRKILEAARNGIGDISASDVQSILISRCRRDPLYFCNVFCWVFEPRPLKQNLDKQILPFVTFEFQDKIIKEMYQALGRKDIDVLKSREQGLTWIALVIAVHDFTFGEMSSGQLVSRKQDLVDKTGEQDTLFWKVLFILKNLPHWMRPKYTKTFMSMVNETTGYVITGAATTGDVGRGGRKKWIILDEYAAFSQPDSYAVDAATQHNTNCRIRISTPQGALGAFYDCFQKTDSPSLQIRSHWSDHPYKMPGLYSSNKGGLQIKDYEYWRNYLGVGDEVDDNTLVRMLRSSSCEYTFVLDEKLRSPWYDFQCERSTRAWLIAQELDMDFLGSGNQYFDAKFLSRIEEMTIPPLFIGNLEFDPDTCEPTRFTESDDGMVKLWCSMDSAGGSPPGDRKYAAGCDVSQGTGASSSAMLVFDARTGEQVAEITSNRLTPDLFAKLCVSIARWFEGNDGDGAKLAWEANGPGRPFGAKVLDLGYTNIYYRKREDRVTKQRTDYPGWHSTHEGKTSLFGDFAAALNEDKMLIRSRAVVDEMRQYRWEHGNKVVHSGDSMDDASDSGDNHGDRVIAAAVTLKCMGDVHSPQNDVPKIVPRNSIAGRLKMAAEEESVQLRREW